MIKDDNNLPISKSQYFETTWKLVEHYYKDNKGYQLVKHLLDSYNDFVMKKIDNVLDGFNPIEVYHHFLQDEQKFANIIVVEVRNPIMSKPTIHEKDGSSKIMTPTDARNRNVTYAAPLFVELVITVKSYNPETQSYTEEMKRIQNVCLGKIPVMVNSRYCVLSTCPTLHNDECRYDFGGYFIINGNEKAVISQDRIAENKTYVFLNNKVSAYSHVAEIRSVTENKFSVPKTTSLKLSAKPNQFGRYIRVNIHHIKSDIPLFTLFRALGVESDRQIINYIVRPTDPNYKVICAELVGSVEESNNIMCLREAREYLVRYMNINGHPKELMSNKPYRFGILLGVLEKEFLPHVGSDLDKKAMYLGYMVNKLISCYLGLLPYDDRDSYINKRVDPPGILIANLFRQYYGKVVKDMRNMIQKEINTGSWKATNKLINVINKVNINKIVKSTIIESGLKFGLATGNWGIKSSKTKQGVAQVLNRMTYNATISHLRRINTPIEKTGKLVQPRKLHATQWGIVCPSETPEGVSVGLVKNLAVMSSVTIASNSTFLRKILDDMDMGITHYKDGNIDIFEQGTKVFVNGDLIGVHHNAFEFVERIKVMKRKGIVNVYTSVYWNVGRDEIWICTEGGRCVRPLYIIGSDNTFSMSQDLVKLINGGKVTWHDLVCGTEPYVNTPLIEYLDVEECNSAMIAMRYQDLEKGFKGSRYPVKYTHLEIDPSLILGVLAGSIPFSDHNQAPRNTYQSSMGKQAIGIYTSNYRRRFDTMGHILNYPQVPLVQTRISKLINGDKLPCGMNVIVAIATWTGFNQEDSIIMNKSAVDRGMFISTYYRTYKDQNTKNHSTGEEEYYCKPDMTVTKSTKPYNYNKLNMDGFVTENTMVESGDVIIGKCMPQKHGSVILNKDSSVALKNNEIGFVDRNSYNDNLFTNVNGDGYTFSKVRIRSDRVPTIGDKFSSRGGQKGTVGMIYNQCDMPFSQSGITPDIIMNPHAIPSRMTIGQLMECIMGKACASLGTMGDATPFTDLSMEDIAAALDKCGLERYGNEVFYNSRTGEMMGCDIFMGPTYYQRLKHMVADKCHCYSGDTDVLTHKGWISIKDLNMEHKVASLVDGALVYQYPSEVQKFHYEGKMYSLETQQVNLLVTPNHRMYVRTHRAKSYKMQTAEEIFGKHIRYKKNVDVWNPDLSDAPSELIIENGVITKFHVPNTEYVFDINTWLTFYGIWIAEGCVNKMDFHIDIAAHKQRVRDALTAIEPELYTVIGKKFNKCSDGTAYNGTDNTNLWKIYNAKLGRYMLRFSVGSVNKSLPEWVWYLSRDQSQALLYAMCLGDGCKSKKGQGNWTYSTSSTKLADDYQRLVLHAGWSTKKGLHHPAGRTAYSDKVSNKCITSTADSWQLFTNTFKNEPCLNHRPHNPRQDKWVDYNENVYCCTVPQGEGVIYVRRKGVCVWSGNSRASNGPIVAITRQPAEGRARDGGLRLGEMEVECNWAHGTMQFLKERTMDNSDNYRVFVCKKCGSMANVNPDKNIYQCAPCNNHTHFAEVRIPYACKLLFQEIQTMGINAKLMT